MWCAPTRTTSSGGQVAKESVGLREMPALSLLGVPGPASETQWYWMGKAWAWRAAGMATTVGGMAEMRASSRALKKSRGATSRISVVL